MAQVPHRAAGLVDMPAILDYLLLHDQVPEAPIVHGRLKLSDILPPNEWWRIYLDREDHEKALRIPGNPGSLYDTQLSPGFQASMINAYQLVLEGDDYAVKFANASFTYADYKAWHDLVTFKVEIEPRKPSDTVSFGIEPGLAAADARGELLLGRPLIIAWAEMQDPDDAIAVLSVSKPKGTGKLMTCVALDQCHVFVTAAIQRFQLEIGQAQNRKAQLYAIAKFIRLLHVLHPFSDGNGRLHVHFLLQRLLMQYHFGPPLRLGAFCSPSTLFGLFNGCFTLDQIVVFLWHSQQLPHQAIESLDLSTVTHW